MSSVGQMGRISGVIFLGFFSCGNNMEFHKPIAISSLASREGWKQYVYPISNIQITYPNQKQSAYRE